MQLILQGSLRQFPLPQLLAFFAQHAHTGTLDIEAKPKRARIFLRDGRVVWGEATGLTDVTSVVVDACMWQGGAFTMLDEVVLPEGVVAHDLEVATLLEELARRIELAASFPDATTFRVVEDSPEDQLSLTPDELRLLIRIGGGKTFAEIIAGRDRFAVAKTLKQLEASGLVERLEGAAAPAAADETPHVAAPPPPPAPPKPQPKPVADPEATRIEPMLKRESKVERKPEPKPEPKPAPAPPPPPAAETIVESAASKRTAGNQLIASLTTDSGLAFALVEDEQSIGRDATNAIAVPDGSISVRHARIRRTPQGFVIEDIGSRNGTFVNSEKVTEPRQLADNDLIRLGKVIFTFNIAAEMKKGETTSGGTSRP